MTDPHTNHVGSLTVRRAPWIALGAAAGVAATATLAMLMGMNSPRADDKPISISYDAGAATVLMCDGDKLYQYILENEKDLNLKWTYDVTKVGALSIKAEPPPRK